FGHLVHRLQATLAAAAASTEQQRRRSANMGGVGFALPIDVHANLPRGPPVCSNLVFVDFASVGQMNPFRQIGPVKIEREIAMRAEFFLLAGNKRIASVERDLSRCMLVGG